MAADHGAGGVKSPEVLAELESHLREDVEQQMQTGTEAAEAFETAVQRIGQAAVLEGEFDKVGGLKAAGDRVDTRCCLWRGFRIIILTII